MTAKQASTKQSTTNPKREGAEQIEEYLDMLMHSQKLMAEALESARLRGVRIGDELSKSTSEGQREILELGKRLAHDPTAYADNYKAVLESVTDAQGRTLELAKVMYSEQTEAGSEMRELMKSLFEASKESGKAAAELGRAWAKNNPFAEMMQKGLDSLKTT